MKFFLGHKVTSFRTQRIVAKDVDLRPSASKVLTMVAGSNLRWQDLIPGQCGLDDGAWYVNLWGCVHRCTI